MVIASAVADSFPDFCLMPFLPTPPAALRAQLLPHLERGIDKKRILVLFRLAKQWQEEPCPRKRSQSTRKSSLDFLIIFNIKRNVNHVLSIHYLLYLLHCIYFFRNKIHGSFAPRVNSNIYFVNVCKNVLIEKDSNKCYAVYAKNLVLWMCRSLPTSRCSWISSLPSASTELTASKL